MPDHVWYAAYGSNLSPERFSCYLRGGRPTGARRTYAGCADRSDPTGRRAIELPGRVLFGGESPVWGGGVAFYEPDCPGPTPATAYRVTAAQFADVWAQERRLADADLPLDRLLAHGEWAAGPERYDRVLLVGWIDQEPVLTFTFPAGHRPQDNPPAPAYAATIRRGLAQTHGPAAVAGSDLTVG